MRQRNTTQRDKDRARLRKLGAPCHICGEPIDYSLHWPHPKCFVADHVRPFAHGGADDVGNKLPAHRDCNQRKGTDTSAVGVVRRSGVLR